MAIFNMHRAKSELSDLVARAEAGEEIVIARRNKPAVKLVPVANLGEKKGVPGMPANERTAPGFAESEQAEFGLHGREEAPAGDGDFGVTREGKIAPTDNRARRVGGFGMLAHMPAVPDGFFFDPLAEEDLKAWEGDGSFDPSRP